MSIERENSLGRGNGENFIFRLLIIRMHSAFSKSLMRYIGILIVAISETIIYRMRYNIIELSDLESISLK